MSSSKKNTLLTNLLNRLSMLNFKKIILRLSILIIGFITLVLFINLSIFDEELDPEIVELLKPTPEPPPYDNAYYALWGIGAAPDRDMMDSGIAFVKRYNQNLIETKKEKVTDQDYIDTLGAKHFGSLLLKEYPNCRARTEHGCLSKINKILSKNPISDPDMLLMFERYDSMIKLPTTKYSIKLTPASPLPYYGLVMQLGLLKKVSVYQSSDSAAFLEQINRDIKFWKMMLIKDEVLLGKMVSVAAIWNNVQLLSEYIKLHELSGQDKDLILDMIQSLTKEELDIGTSFDSEFASYNHVFLVYLKDEFFISQNSYLAITPFLQTNSTLNTYFKKYFKPSKTLSKMPLHRFIQYFNKCKGENPIWSECIKNNISTPNILNPTSYYNLAGKIIMPILAINFESYVARVHDLNTMIRLVNLQLSLKTVDKELIPQAIKESEFNNPYTNKPMDYDAENGWLSFECLDKSSVCKVKL